MSRWPVPLAVALVCLLGPRVVGADKPAADAAAVMRYAELLKDDSAVVRKRAAIALGRLGAKARVALPALEKALTDKDKGVRQAVAEALEAIDLDAKHREKPAAPTPPLPPVEKPGVDRIGVGIFVPAKGSPHFLVRRPHTDRDKSTWRIVPDRARVHTGEDLLSLPGALSRVRLDGGVELVLRGSVPEFARTPEMFYLLESAVTLNRPAKGVDVDLTYHRGRIYLRNHKREGATLVRLHFEDQTWDLTLQDPGTEVGMDFLKAYTRDIDYKTGAAPRAEVYLSVLVGKAKLRPKGVASALYLDTPPGRALVMWDNKGRGLEGPFTLPKVPPVWDKGLPAPTDPQRMKEVQKMTRALLNEGKRLAGGNVKAAVWEGLDVRDAVTRQLSIYTVGAIDDVRHLLEALGDGNPAHAADRNAAVFTLRRWVSRSSGQGRRLYDPRTETGLLVDTRQCRGKEAETLVALLHDFNDRDRNSPETFELLANYLAHNKVAIAQLAFYHLQRMVGKVELPHFNAAAPHEQRRRVAEAVLKMIKDGKLPPTPARPKKG